MDTSGDGYVDCNPIAGKAITVWRQFANAPELSFENSTNSFAVNTKGTQPATDFADHRHAHRRQTTR